MKTRYFKKIFASALMVTAILGTSSCINDLDISPIDPQYAPSFDQNDVFVKEYALLTRVRDNILKSKEQKNIQPTKGGHKMVTCQNYVSLFYRQITSCPSDGGIS